MIEYEWNDSDLMDSLNADKGGVKTLISIGGWSFSQGETPTYGISSKTVFSDMAASPSSRAAFISSAIEFAADRHNFDGNDLDWEFPEEADRENFIASWPTCGLLLMETDVASSSRPLYPRVSTTLTRLPLTALRATSIL